ncbi:AraC family transcriptional regulator [Paenibacillus sp. J23TS9]|uniref:AraC family transcriptional regulator n=1 Tax=Paenibacillus sp. J23TS9 TaxID=2807193 RepID=UPI001B2AAA3A|nr:AraC family transcriptional regulator [Paenibacillus sp. J23TS9]GIP25676.1 AraC family transcriptional regulator [Paenibacillus sp. J23TS9]
MMNHEYKDRIETVIRYIEENSSDKLTLDLLADMANFSKYHFSRIFTAIVGVTPVAFVNRERIQKSVHLLADTPLTILEISNQCGFESLSTFNAAFKKHYGQTPSEVRRGMRNDSNFPSFYSKNPEESAFLEEYNQNRKNSLLTRVWDQMIRFEELMDIEVAYVRHVGSYLDTYSAWDKLGRWAAGRGISPANQQFIGISLDDLNLVDEWACRYDACVTLPAGHRKEHDSKVVDYKILSGGLYAVYPYYDTVERFVLAYQNVYSLWLPNSGYEADDRPCLEICKNDPATDAEGKCKVDLHVPIKKRG